MDSKFLRALVDTDFNDFITLRVLKMLYGLLLVAIGVGSVLLIAASIASGSFLAALASLLLVPLGALIAVILIRVALETTVMLFSVGRNTDKIARM